MPGGCNAQENKTNGGRRRPDHVSRELAGVRPCFGEQPGLLRCLPLTVERAQRVGKAKRKQMAPSGARLDGGFGWRRAAELGQ